MSGARQKTDAPEYTENVLRQLQRTFGIDAVQFYDNNFFLREADAFDLAERLVPLQLQWWCEARIDIVLRYSDETLRAIRRAGCRMIFFGAESGSDKMLQEMHKQLSTAQILDLAARIRNFDIVPEFSFVLGNPEDPDRDFRQTSRFIRRIKQINPSSEIVVQHFIPTPHPDGMYGKVDAEVKFPSTPEEWASDQWLKFTTRRDPHLPWLPPRTKKLIDGFETVLNSRWPTVQDIRMGAFARTALKALGSWRYLLGVYSHPYELMAAQKLLKLRQPRVESL